MPSKPLEEIRNREHWGGGGGSVWAFEVKVCGERIFRGMLHAQEKRWYSNAGNTFHRSIKITAGFLFAFMLPAGECALGELLCLQQGYQTRLHHGPYCDVSGLFFFTFARPGWAGPARATSSPRAACLTCLVYTISESRVLIDWHSCVDVRLEALIKLHEW